MPAGWAWRSRPWAFAPFAQRFDQGLDIVVSLALLSVATPQLAVAPD
jgi:hypothetical protein